MDPDRHADSITRPEDSHENRPRRLVTVSHSSVVTLNRRLANELARVGGGNWDVTAVAPRIFHGDLSPLTLKYASEVLAVYRSLVHGR